MELVGMSKLKSVEMVEATSYSPTVEWTIGSNFIQWCNVIFTYSKIIITIFVKHFSYSCLITRHNSIVTGEATGTIIQRSHVYRMVIATCEQSSTGWGTNTGRVKVSVPQTIISQTIQHGCLH